MSSAESNRAVFLSYASQDAEAARRICEALRSGGVEVWFDADGGLEHGDEWDAKIRRQIKECVLFIPIISANTQARHEGYFRIEWELAAQRAMGIASGVAFILPVVIDDTREQDALVPDRFRMVQWTRLPGGVVSPEVKARYLKLWSHRIGAAKGVVAEPGHTSSSERDERIVPPTVPPPQRRATWVALAGVVLAAAVAGFFALRPKPPTGPATPSASAAPLSESRLRLQKARTLMSEVNASRTNFDAAHELLAQAVKLDPNDASAWGAWAELDYLYRYWGMDRAEERISESRRKAQRALAIDPENRDALLAHAVSLVFGPNAARQAPEVEATLQRLLQRNPEDAAALIQLGHQVVRVSIARTDEALGYYARAARVPAFTRQAEEAAGLAQYLGLRFQAAEEKLDQLLAQEKTWQALRLKALVALEWRGDLERAKQALEALPPSLLLEDFFVGTAFNVYRSSRDYARLIELFRAITSDFVFSNVLSGPRALFLGEALEWAGRPEAAALAYNEALQAVDRRLAEKSGEPLYLGWRAHVLARLGRLDEARKALHLASQVYDGKLPALHSMLRTYAQVGRVDDALAELERQFNEPSRPPYVFTAAVLRLEPNLDLLRPHPRFQALLAKAEADPRFSPTARKASAVPEAKSVAVLPFVNQSADKDNEYFSDGIAEELLTVLQKIPGLKVAARTSAWSFKGKNVTLKEVGETLGMVHVVEGSVQKSGNKVKITARLSRAATNEEVWSKSFGPLELTDVFATQSEIAQNIVAELRGRLVGDAAATEIQAQVQAARKGGTKNAEAHQLYLQGKFFLNKFTLDEAKRAIGYFERALALDAKFALAWAALADAHNYLGGYSTRPDDMKQGFNAAREAAQRALSLEPDLANSLRVLAESKMNRDFDWKGAKPLLDRARQLAPLDPEVLSSAAWYASSTGQVDQAVTLTRQAVSLDPVNPLFRINLGGYLSVLRQYREAEAEYKRAIELSPTAPWTFSGLAMCYALQGRFAEAEATARQDAVEWTRLTALAAALWGKGAKAEADATLQQLIDGASGVAAYQIAGIYGFRREHDRAFEWLERALRQRDPGLVYTKTDVWFHSLHTDPRWPAFLRKMGLHDEQLHELR